MNSYVASLLHPRVATRCTKLFDDGHYPDAAYRAMNEVEVALKEKSGVRNKFGSSLVRFLFGNGCAVKLRVPFGEQMQEKAERLFCAAFSYYRNYAAHEGGRIDERICVRMLILASELLDLVGASTVSFADIGGLHGLIRYGEFESEESVRTLLRFLDGYQIVNDVVDGFFEELALKGYSERQLGAVIDTGLIEYLSSRYIRS
ncbi:MAG TPA: TIGR02391 family protein, partial [Candidatus Hydrogenedentes bacterium]|nr:TIGR02391 family protein [Candidatus Hydrogenedentota bacterium]